MPLQLREGRVRQLGRAQQLGSRPERGALASVEARGVEVATVDRRDLLVARAGRTRDGNVLGPFVGSRRALADLEDQQLAQAGGQGEASEDGAAELEQRPEAGVGVGHHPEDVQLDRQARHGLAHLLGRGREIDVR